MDKKGTQGALSSKNVPAPKTDEKPPAITAAERLQNKISKMTIEDAVRAIEVHKKYIKKRKDLKDPNEKREPRLSLDIAEISELSINRQRLYSMTDSEEQELRKAAEQSDSTRLIMTGIRPAQQPKGISGYTMDEFKESQIPNCPAGMEEVIELDHIFILPASKDDFLKVFPESLKYMYEVKSIDGKQLYIGGETYNGYNSYPSKVKELDFTFTGPTGGLVFYVYGNSKMLKIGNEDQRFGKIVRVGLSEKPLSFYKILDQNDDPIFELIPSVNHSTKETEYKVLCLKPKTHKVIGIIKSRHGDLLKDITGTNSSGRSELFSQGDVFGINFPKDLNPTNKTLLIGTTIFLKHRLTVPISYGPNKRRFKTGVIFSVGVGILIFIGLLIIIISILISNVQKETHPIYNCSEIWK